MKKARERRGERQVGLKQEGREEVYRRAVPPHSTMHTTNTARKKQCYYMMSREMEINNRRLQGLNPENSDSHTMQLVYNEIADRQNLANRTP